MANYASLYATIAANIYENHLNQVTAEMVKAACDSMVASLGYGYQFRGAAAPGDAGPGNIDQRVFYIASTPGTYSGFGGLTLAANEVALLKWDSAWSKETLDIPSKTQIMARLAAQDAQIAVQNGRLDGQDEEIADFEEAVQNQVDNYPMITINGNVTNAPDEEDITSDANDLLKFKNRSAVDGMGYVILRKGGDNTFANQVTAANTIYEIRYDFDLNDVDGENPVTIPAGCTLLFNGGRLMNGALVGSDTNISAKPETIFENIRISGGWEVLEIFDKWFSGDDDVVYLSLLSLLSDSVNNVLHINGNYTITTRDGGYLVKSNTTIELNGTITAKDGTLYGYQMLYINGAENVRIFGGGKIIGDKDSILRPNPENGQWGHGIRVARSNNVIIEGLTITKCYGDGVCISYDSNDMTVHNNGVIVRNMILDNNWRQGISITDGTQVIVENCVIKNTNGHSPSASIDIEPEAGCVVKNISISNCEFSENNHCILVGRNVSGTKENSVLEGIKISSIKFTSSFAYYGIRLNAVDDVIIENVDIEISANDENDSRVGLFVQYDSNNVRVSNCTITIPNGHGHALRLISSESILPKNISLVNCIFTGGLYNSVKNARDICIDFCKFNRPFAFDSPNTRPTENVRFSNNVVDISSVSDEDLTSLFGANVIYGSALYANTLRNAIITGNILRDGKDDRVSIATNSALYSFSRTDNLRSSNYLYIASANVYECVLSANRYVTSGETYTVYCEDTIDMLSSAKSTNLVRVVSGSNTPSGKIVLTLKTFACDYGFRGANNALDYDAGFTNWRKDTIANIKQYSASKLMHFRGEQCFATDLLKPVWFTGSDWVDGVGTAI